MKELKKDMKKVIVWMLGIFVLYLVVRYWEKLEHVVSAGVGAAAPLILGLVMAYVINILMAFYEKWYEKLFRFKLAQKGKRWTCLILAFVSLGGIIFLIINLVLPELINCIASFINMIPKAINWLIQFVGEERIEQYFPTLMENLNMNMITDRIEQIVTSVLNGFTGAVNSIMAMVSGMVSVVVTVFIGLIFSIYALLDKEKLSKRCKQMIEVYVPKKADRIFYVLKVLNESFHNFIVGQVTEAVVIGVLCIIGMTIFRFPYAVMVGVFIGFTALVPIAGAYIGAIVGAVLMLATDPILAIEFLIFIIVLQQLEGNLIYPKVVGKSIGLPGMWVLTAVTVGGGVMGIGGMLLAVPLFAAGYRLLREDLERRTPAPADGTAVDAEVDLAEGKGTDAVISEKKQEEQK